MHRLISCAAALAVLTLTAAGEPPTRTPRAEAALQKALAGRTPGKPESCVSLSELGSQRIIDRNTILFEGHGGRIWRNDLPHGCPGLAPGRAILTKPTLTRHCRGDIFQIIDPPAHMTLGACGFGDFVPYTKQKP